MKTIPVIYFRGFSWFFRKGWYALRWGVEGAVHGDTVYLVDVGAITFGYRKQLEQPERIKILEEFVRDCRDNWDCDSDAHRYNTTCRCCDAKKILPKSLDNAR